MAETSLIKDTSGAPVESRMVLDDMTVEDAREFLKKLGDALDENRLHDNEPAV